MARITKKEFEIMNAVLTGTKNPNAAKNRAILDRPHVAATLEAILDKEGLTDEKLTRRLREIVNRKKENQVLKNGSMVSNQTIVDNNAMNAIRTIWQVKGKFTEKHEHTVLTEMKDMDDDQLDSIIHAGTRFISKNKSELN